MNLELPDGDTRRVPEPRVFSERGRVTRGALTAAARVVFERDGFAEARIVDITQAARVATGSFYRYFADKQEALAAVLESVQEESLHLRLPETTDRSPAAMIEAACRAYLTSYRANARLMALVAEVSETDAGFRALRLERGRAYDDRNARSIARLQDAGLADASLDAVLAGRALSGMVGRLAYRVFVVGEDVDFDYLVATVTRLWCNAIGLTASHRRTS